MGDIFYLVEHSSSVFLDLTEVGREGIVIGFSSLIDIGSVAS